MPDDPATRAGLPVRGARALFSDVRWFAEVRSTNSVLAELGRRAAPEGVVVVADHQTAGRGRLGRRWEAPAGSSLLLSVLLRPALSVAELPLTTLLVALAACDACVDVARVSPLLKWPNDLTVAGRKLGGVLAETVPGPDGRAVIVGLGLNVTWAPSPPASGVSLEQVAGHPVDRSELLAALLRHLEDRYRALDGRHGRSDLVAAYRARSATLGRAVRVEREGGVLEGRAVDVTPEGHLVAEIAGRRRVFAAADVIHLRPGGEGL